MKRNSRKILLLRQLNKWIVCKRIGDNKRIDECPIDLFIYEFQLIIRLVESVEHEIHGGGDGKDADGWPSIGWAWWSWFCIDLHVGSYYAGGGGVYWLELEEADGADALFALDDHYGEVGWVWRGGEDWFEFVDLFAVAEFVESIAEC